MISYTQTETLRTHDDLRDLVSSTCFRMGARCEVTPLNERASENVGKLRVWIDRNKLVSQFEAHVYSLPVPAANIESLITRTIQGNNKNG